MTRDDKAGLSLFLDLQLPCSAAIGQPGHISANDSARNSVRETIGPPPPAPLAAQVKRCHCIRDSNGISKLTLIQLILPYKISCIRGSSEIPLLSLIKCMRLKTDHNKDTLQRISILLQETVQSSSVSIHRPHKGTAVVLPNSDLVSA